MVLMAGFEGLLITEIFHSIQGETSLSGKPFVFVRLTGCNLRCTYCDSAYAFHGGTRMTIEEVTQKATSFGCPDILLTGGEPLLQKGTIPLIHSLKKAGFQVHIETHGEHSIQEASPHARIIMDIKTPSSGMCRGMFKENLPHLKPSDEVKFVIASQDDYVWARELIQSGTLPTTEILMSPANLHPEQPGEFPGIEPVWLATRILEDRLDVRFQLQIHKIVWDSTRRGV